MAQTENIGLPLDVHGLVVLRKSFKDAMNIIDEQIANLGGGSVAAEDVTVTAIAGTTGTDVQAVLEDLAARVAVLEQA